MKPTVRAEMLKLAEGKKADGTAPVEFSTNDLLRLVDNALWPRMGLDSPLDPEGNCEKAISALDGLAKLGFDKRDLDNLREHFKYVTEGESKKKAAQLSMSRLRDEYWADKDGSNRGMAMKAY